MDSKIQHNGKKEELELSEDSSSDDRTNLDNPHQIKIVIAQQEESNNQNQIQRKKKKKKKKKEIKQISEEKEGANETEAISSPKTEEKGSTLKKKLLQGILFVAVIIVASILIWQLQLRKTSPNKKGVEDASQGVPTGLGQIAQVTDDSTSSTSETENTTKSETENTTLFIWEQTTGNFVNGSNTTFMKVLPRCYCFEDRLNFEGVLVPSSPIELDELNNGNNTRLSEERKKYLIYYYENLQFSKCTELQFNKCEFMVTDMNQLVLRTNSTINATTVSTVNVTTPSIASSEVACFDSIHSTCFEDYIQKEMNIGLISTDEVTVLLQTDAGDLYTHTIHDYILNLFPAYISHKCEESYFADCLLWVDKAGIVQMNVFNASSTHTQSYMSTWQVTSNTSSQPYVPEQTGSTATEYSMSTKEVLTTYNSSQKGTEQSGSTGTSTGMSTRGDLTTYNSSQKGTEQSGSTGTEKSDFTT